MGEETYKMMLASTRQLNPSHTVPKNSVSVLQHTLEGSLPASNSHTQLASELSTLWAYLLMLVLVCYLSLKSLFMSES